MDTYRCFCAALASLLMAGSAALGAATLPVIKVSDQQGVPVSEAVVLLLGAAALVPAASEVVVDQVNLTFVPRVVVVPKGGSVRFPNSDATRHHVYSFSDAKTFELRLYKANDAPPVQFEKTGLVLLGCNIHDSMRGFIWVTDEQVFAVSDSEGRLSLPEFVAADQARFRVWHPQLSEPIELSLTDLKQQDDVLSIVLPFTLVVTGANQTSVLRNRLQRFKKHGD